MSVVAEPGPSPIDCCGVRGQQAGLLPVRRHIPTFRATLRFTVLMLLAEPLRRRSPIRHRAALRPNTAEVAMCLAASLASRVDWASTGRPALRPAGGGRAPGQRRPHRSGGRRLAGMYKALHHSQNHRAPLSW